MFGRLKNKKTKYKEEKKTNNNVNMDATTWLVSTIQIASTPTKSHSLLLRTSFLTRNTFLFILRIEFELPTAHSYGISLLLFNCSKEVIIRK